MVRKVGGGGTERREGSVSQVGREGESVVGGGTGEGEGESVVRKVGGGGDREERRECESGGESVVGGGTREGEGRVW